MSDEQRDTFIIGDLELSMKQENSAPAPATDYIEAGAERLVHEIFKEYVCWEDGHIKIANGFVGTLVSRIASLVSNAVRRHDADHQAQLIRRYGMMCEAHPGLEFCHDTECGGPGMPWIVEGKEAITEIYESAHSRDFEVRSILEMLGSDAVHVREDGGIEDIYASLAVSVSKLQQRAEAVRELKAENERADMEYDAMAETILELEKELNELREAVRQKEAELSQQTDDARTLGQLLTEARASLAKKEKWIEGLLEERQQWLTWADALTGNKEYLPSGMRRDIAERLKGEK